MTAIQLRVLCGEAVVSYGTRETRWWLHHDGRWTRVDRIPDVESKSVSAGPGTIWHTLFEVRVEVGTWVMRVDTEPAPERMSDPLRYLEKERRGGRRRVTRRFYQVERNGELSARQRERAPK